MRYISPNQTLALEQFAESLELMTENLKLEIRTREMELEIQSLRTGIFLVQDLNAVPFVWDRDKLYGGSSNS